MLGVFGLSACACPLLFCVFACCCSLLVLGFVTCLRFASVSRVWAHLVVLAILVPAKVARGKIGVRGVSAKRPLAIGVWI